MCRHCDTWLNEQMLVPDGRESLILYRCPFAANSLRKQKKASTNIIQSKPRLSGSKLIMW